MRAGQGTFRPGPTPPIVPQPDEDELVSSWLGRTARFYGRPLAALPGTGARRAEPIDVGAADLGLPPRALAPVALLLGTSVERIRERAVAAAHPGAVDLVALVPTPRGSPRGPRLQYAACPHCLEEQRASRGFSWLRREWVLAPRTVCPLHQAVLVEIGDGAAVHPAWSGFFDRHRVASQAVCGRAPAADDAPKAPAEALPLMPCDDLLSAVARVESAILADAARGGPGAPRNSSGGLPRIVRDLVWAFTRVDAVDDRRSVYEAFASDALDNPWHVARRRADGPVEFNRLPLRLRHLLQATATALAGPAALRTAIFGGGTSWADDVAAIQRLLRPCDRAEFGERRAQWSAAAGR